jgi:hypothetical protein
MWELFLPVRGIRQLGDADEWRKMPELSAHLRRRQLSLVNLLE